MCGWVGENANDGASRKQSSMFDRHDLCCSECSEAFRVPSQLRHAKNVAPEVS